MAEMSQTGNDNASGSTAPPSECEDSPEIPQPPQHHKADEMQRTMNQMVDALSKMTKQQKRMVRQQNKAIKHRIEMINLLKRIDDRQEQVTSTKPIAEVPAKSSSAWNPLLDSTMEHFIKPDVDRWRSTVDTLLIFIALFSAVVTSFLVQASSGLSQNPGDRTNELLSNLTNIIIQLSGTNTASFAVPSPVPFEPDPTIVRLNVYWVLSLIVSLCVACLSVVGRGYLTSLLRFHHSQAHEKLVEVYTRWKESDRLLRPAVETLPQMLILAVCLFVAGLLDSLLSSALPLVSFSIPILGAGVLSITFVAISGAAIILTIFHGCAYPATSPFQSQLAILLNKRRPAVLRVLRAMFRLCGKAKVVTRPAGNMLWAAIFISRVLIDHVVQSLLVYGSHVIRRWISAPEDTWYTGHFDDEEVNLLRNDQPVMASAFDVYHETLLLTHNDVSVDYAAAAFWDIVRPTLPGLRTASTPWHSEKMVADSLVYLLSPECSQRANLTAASIIIKIEHECYLMRFSSKSKYELAVALCQAAERDRLAVSRNNVRARLWKSMHMQALTTLLVERRSPNARDDAPCIALLFANASAFRVETPTARIKHLIDSVRLEALYVLDTIVDDTLKSHFTHSDYDEGYSIYLLESLASPLIPLHDQGYFINSATIPGLVDFWCTANLHASQHSVLLTLFLWLCQSGCDAFVQVVLDPDRISKLFEYDRSWRLKDLIHATTFFQPANSPSYNANSEIDSFILHTMVSLMKLFDSGYTLSCYQDDIIMILGNLAERTREQLQHTECFDVLTVLHSENMWGMNQHDKVSILDAFLPFFPPEVCRDDAYSIAPSNISQIILDSLPLRVGSPYSCPEPSVTEHTEVASTSVLSVPVDPVN